jgi:hypothetical protein
MKALIWFTLWCILLCISWPLALVVLVLAPVVWAVLLPFPMVGAVFGGLLAVLVALVWLPVRLLGWLLREPVARPNRA